MITNSWITTVEISCARNGEPALLATPSDCGSRPSFAMSTIGSAHSICQDTYAPSTDRHKPIEMNTPPHGPTTASSTAPIEFSGSAASSSWVSTP